MTPPFMAVEDVKLVKKCADEAKNMGASYLDCFIKEGRSLEDLLKSAGFEHIDTWKKVMREIHPPEEHTSDYIEVPGIGKFTVRRFEAGRDEEAFANVVDKAYRPE